MQPFSKDQPYLDQLKNFKNELDKFSKNLPEDHFEKKAQVSLFREQFSEYKRTIKKKEFSEIDSKEACKQIIKEIKSIFQDRLIARSIDKYWI